MATSVGKNPYGGSNNANLMAYAERFNPGYFNAGYGNLYPNGFPGTGNPSAPAPAPTSQPQPVNTPPRVPSGGQMPTRPAVPGLVQPGVSMGRGNAAGNTGFAGNKPQVAAARQKRQLTPQEQAARAAQGLFGNDAGAAGTLSDYMFAEGTLGRLNEGTGQAMQGILGQYGNAANQYAQGGRTNAQGQAIGRMDNIANQYANGGRSQDMSGVLGSYQNFLQGYSGQEGQAMREQAERGLNSQFQTGLRAQQSASRRNRLSGASQAAQVGDLAQQRLMSQSGVETDLAVRGADEKRAALDRYSQALGAQESAEFGRQLTSAEAAGNYLTSQEDKDFDRMRSTQDAQYTAQRDADATQLDKEKFNLGNKAAEIAGRYGTYFGAMDVAEQRRQAKRSNKLSRRGLKAYERSLNTR